MLSLASLLNPAPPGALPPTPRYRPSPALFSSPASSFSSDCHSLFFDRHIMSSKHSKMVKDSGGFVKSKAKGSVNFPPFENLDEHSLLQIKRYQIYPVGKIQEYCRHIPYNSGKKDFFEKTGRESFEGQSFSPVLAAADHRTPGEIPSLQDSMLIIFMQCSNTSSRCRVMTTSIRSCGTTM